MPETRYDYGIAGAGVSGLCLADALTRQFPRCRVLLIDPVADPDYNISFWTDGEIPPLGDTLKTWHQLAVQCGSERRVCPLRRYRLHSLWRADLDRVLTERLRQTGRATFLDEALTHCIDHGDGVEITTTHGSVRVGWLFDSRPKPLPADPAGLSMAGLTCELRATRPVFDPAVATLFDFVLETPHFDFLYVLPDTPTTALVNYAAVTPPGGEVPEDACARILKRYLAERWGIATGYTVARSYYGGIPLSARRVTRQSGGRVLDIGVRGGMLKPSTSYAFARILTDTAQIVGALERTGRPFYQDARPYYYRATDARMLRVYRRYPALAQRLMFHMFSEADGDVSLAFLDEKNTLKQNLSLFQRVPRPLLQEFLKALILA
jgi:lycopene beta-cyclase